MNCRKLDDLHPSLSRLGELETAMAWSCAAAKMNSAAGRLRCAALQVGIPPDIRTDGISKG